MSQLGVVTEKILVRHSFILPLNILTPDLFCFLAVWSFASLWLFHIGMMAHVDMDNFLVHVFISVVKFCETNTTIQRIDMILMTSDMIIRRFFPSSITQTSWCIIDDCLAVC